MKKRISALECNFLDNSEEITNKVFRFTNLKKIEEILDKKCYDKEEFIFDRKKWRVNIKSQKQPAYELKDFVDIYRKTNIYAGDFLMLFSEYISMGRPKEISIKQFPDKKRYLIKKIK